MVNVGNNLSSTMEDYLETIYTLKQKNGVARVGEIADKLNVKSSSVNSAVKVLVDQDLVIHERYGYVSLTKEGEKTASVIKRKHDILFRFLTEFLMINPANAEHEACSIEHSISKETFYKLTEFFKFLDANLNGKKPKIIQLFKTYLETGERFKCDCEK